MLLSLLRGGMTLSDSLHILAGNEMRREVQSASILLLRLLRTGSTFSVALGQLISVQRRDFSFSKMHLSLLAAAELTGSLDTALEDIVIDLRRRIKASEMLASVLVYPCIVISIAFMGTLLLYIKGIPLFLANGLMSADVVDSAVRGTMLSGVFLLTCGCAMLYLFNTVISRDSDLSSVFYTLSFLMKRGIVLDEALSQCVDCVRNTKTQRALVIIRKNIREGMSVSVSFRQTEQFPPFVSGWMEIANGNGSTADVFTNLARFYHDKDEKLREITMRLVEPCFIVITGIYLLIIIETVILPVLVFAGGMNV
jgi:type II secretory pathway component PulF